MILSSFLTLPKNYLEKRDEIMFLGDKGDSKSWGVSVFLAVDSLGMFIISHRIYYADIIQGLYKDP